MPASTPTAQGPNRPDRGARRTSRPFNAASAALPTNSIAKRTPPCPPSSRWMPARVPPSHRRRMRARVRCTRTASSLRAPMPGAERQAPDRRRLPRTARSVSATVRTPNPASTSNDGRPSPNPSLPPIPAEKALPEFPRPRSCRAHRWRLRSTLADVQGGPDLCDAVQGQGKVLGRVRALLCFCVGH